MNILLCNGLCEGCGRELKMDHAEKVGINVWTLVCENRDCEYLGRHLRLPRVEVEEL